MPRPLKPKRACKGCGSTSRALKAPGPRCATCHREKKKADREAAWAARVYKTYGLTKEQYDELYASQDGCCYICRRATGRTRRLSVDHDHATGYVRGLLCRPCNTLLGKFRDEPSAFQRAGAYLVDPPAFRVIGKVKPDAS